MLAVENNDQLRVITALMELGLSSSDLGLLLDSLQREVSAIQGQEEVLFKKKATQLSMYERKVRLLTMAKQLKDHREILVTHENENLLGDLSMLWYRNEQTSLPSIDHDGHDMTEYTPMPKDTDDFGRVVVWSSVRRRWEITTVEYLTSISGTPEIDNYPRWQPLPKLRTSTI